MWKSLVLLKVLIFWLAKEAATSTDYNIFAITKETDSPKGNLYKTLKGNGRVKCAESCSLDDLCYVFFYNTSSCLLYKTFDGSFEATQSGLGYFGLKKDKPPKPNEPSDCHMMCPTKRTGTCEQIDLDDPKTCNYFTYNSEHFIACHMKNLCAHILKYDKIFKLWQLAFVIPTVCKVTVEENLITYWKNGEFFLVFTSITGVKIVKFDGTYGTINFWKLANDSTTWVNLLNHNDIESRRIRTIDLQLLNGRFIVFANVEFHCSFMCGDEVNNQRLVISAQNYGDIHLFLWNGTTQYEVDKLDTDAAGFNSHWYSIPVVGLPRFFIMNHVKASITKKAIVYVTVDNKLDLSENYIVTKALSRIGSTFEMENKKYVLLTHSTYLQIINIDCALA
ncbi:DgyrCDS804 [Dimorphilus gyrociliatus]|uniref:DgyrCDS804 n=1 Tax=Dimorphilus gyrociliatus TaxID=2664684 RepID=A0A7I8V7G8_9ANNE|nr:DgyrCDS804 [Dimorphilus gyrociliatus]